MWIWALLRLAATAHAGETPDDLLFEVRERIRHGDYAEARALAERAVSLPGDHQRTAQYLQAMAFEFDGDFVAAMAIYDALEAAWPAGQVPDDLRFRRAECLGRLDRFREARKELRRLPHVDRPPEDRLKIDALRGIWEVELGKQRRGYRRLHRAIDEVDPSWAPRYQALARHEILVRATETAALLTFEGSDARKARSLQERATLIAAADTQLAQLVPLEQTDLLLDGFLRQARAHRALGRDMLDESPLSKLTDAQRQVNRDLLEERVAAVWTKASLYYDRGVMVAARMDWTGEPVPTMKREYAATLDEVDALSP
ncbi:MAG: hypothetical protein R3F59_34825 [Myxococcota bacterium]